MKKIQYLKTATIISFLIIAHPGGTLTLNNLLWFAVGVIANFSDLFCFECNQIEALKELLILIIAISSFFFIFKDKKYIVLSCIFIQYLYLFMSFNKNYLNYWFYTVPTVLYMMLSLILLYFVFFKEENKIK
jgi:hypothetical protein